MVVAKRTNPEFTSKSQNFCLGSKRIKYELRICLIIFTPENALKIINENKGESRFSDVYDISPESFWVGFYDRPSRLLEKRSS